MHSFSYLHVNSERPRTALLIPGGPGQPAGTMQFDAECLPPDLSALLIDPPGTGATEAPANVSGYHPAEVAKFYASACDQLKVVPDLVLGTSFGGVVASYLAAQRSDLVRALILVSTMYQGEDVDDAEERGQEIERVLRRHNASNWYAEARRVFDNWEALVLNASSQEEIDSLGAKILPLYISQPNSSAGSENLRRLQSVSHQNMDAMKAWESGLYRSVDLATSLKAVAAPMLVVSGVDDWLAGSRSASALARDFPAAEVSLIENCGHFPALEQPDEYRRVIGQWVKRVHPRPEPTRSHDRSAG